jgi:hypothetical protein
MNNKDYHSSIVIPLNRINEICLTCSNILKNLSTLKPWSIVLIALIGDHINNHIGTQAFKPMA